MTDKDICEAVEEEEESLLETLEALTTTTGKVKPDKTFNCFVIANVLKLCM